MIKSMTGYGRAQNTVNGMEITAEIKSVNHRYFECSCRYPRQYGFLEEKIKSFVSQRVSRGKTEINLTITETADDSYAVTVNESLAKAYIQALNQLQTYGAAPGWDASDIARFPDVLQVTRRECDEEQVWQAVQTVLNVAVDAFVLMREQEGEHLKADIMSRCATILEQVSLIEAKSGETVSEYRLRLEAKIRELLDHVQIDEQRLLTETAIFADKIAIDEETVRLRSHIDQMGALLNSSEPVGRKLDFLVQEMNREANTIGSKSSNTQITKTVVDLKSEIEKIREQIQNIE